MTDDEFERLLEQSIKNFGDKYIDYPEDLDKPFELSAKFEKKMNKLIKKQKRSHHGLISTAVRRAACIAAVLVFAVSGSAITVKAIKNKALEINAETSSDGNDNITIAIDEEDSYPETIELEYTIDVPEGFEIDKEMSYCSPQRIGIYYTNGNKFICFDQMTVYNPPSIAIDNERSKAEELTDSNGITYTIYFWEEDNTYEVIWENYSYIFKVYTNYDGKEIIDLCKLTKK